MCKSPAGWRRASGGLSMKECADCGREVGFFQQINGRCKPCNQRFMRLHLLTQEHGADRAAEILEYEAASSDQEKIDAVILTTEVASDLIIIERIDIVTAECAFGMNIFKDLFASARDIFGGRSRAVQNTMRDARKTALSELRREAYLVGANAVVGVDLDYVELSASGSMVMLVASGTAVRVQTHQDPGNGGSRSVSAPSSASKA